MHAVAHPTFSLEPATQDCPRWNVRSLAKFRLSYMALRKHLCICDLMHNINECELPTTASLDISRSTLLLHGAMQLIMI
jgi:hypothetical protein